MMKDAVTGACGLLIVAGFGRAARCLPLCVVSQEVTCSIPEISESIIME